MSLSIRSASAETAGEGAAFVTDGVAGEKDLIWAVACQLDAKTATAVKIIAATWLLNAGLLLVLVGIGALPKV